MISRGRGFSLNEANSIFWWIVFSLSLRRKENDNVYYVKKLKIKTEVVNMAWITEKFLGFTMMWANARDNQHKTHITAYLHEQIETMRTKKTNGETDNNN